MPQHIVLSSENYEKLVKQGLIKEGKFTDRVINPKQSK